MTLNMNTYSPSQMPILTTYEKQLTPEHLPLIEQFCQAAATRGFTNNASLKMMKYAWCLSEGGIWVGTFNNDKIVSLSGIHLFKDGWRGVFRGAQIEPRATKGLDRYQKSSQSIWGQLPSQIEYAESKSGKDVPIYITTNIAHDASGWATRVHNLFKILGKTGVLTHTGDEEIFHTQQSVWKLNREKYYEILRS
jgi:hypothetical protein